MKKKSIIKNYVYNLSYQLLVIFIPLVTTPYLSRILGPSNIGIYSFTISISAYFILFGCLGITTYAQKEIAYVQDSKTKRTKLFYELFLLKTITMTISIFIFALTMLDNNEYSSFYKILILELIANIIDISWFFQGMEEFKKTVGRNLIVRLISVICIFLFIKSDQDLMKYYFIYVFSILFGNASLWLYLPKFIGKINIKELQIFRHLKSTIQFFIPQLAIQIYTILDKSMIGWITNDMDEVGFYEQSQKIIKMLMLLISSIGTVMLPRIANLFAKNKTIEIKKYMYRTFTFIFEMGFPLVLGVISVSKNFVPIFFGQGYDKVKIIMPVLSPIIMFIGMSNVIGNQYLLTTNQVKKYTISVTVGAIINFIFNMFLIKKYGAIGAAIATVVAEFSVTLTQSILVRKELDIFKAFIHSLKYLLFSIIMFLICLLIEFFVNNDFLSLIFKIMIGGFYYFIVLYITKDELILDLKNEIIKRRKK